MGTRAGCVPLLVVVFLAAPGAAVRAQQGVDGLLPRATETAYRGRKVVIDFSHASPQVTSMTVLCQPGGRERREFHATHGLLVVDGQSSWQYLPDQGVVLKRRSRGEGGEQLRPELLRRALASYEVRVSASEPVAGRRSRALEFMPRQGGSRPRRRIWVDEETGLVLRTEVYGTDSRLSSLTVFEDLEYRPALDAAIFTMRVPAGARVVEAGDEPCLEPEEAARVAGLAVTLPAYLPEGFARQCIRARRRRDYGEVQVVFGDGLSLLSLFESTSFRSPGPAAGPAVPVGPWSGRWHALGLVSGISWRTPWANFALLGELSRDELLRVAGSVQEKAEPSAARRHP
ncbi:MAG TPA: sigma-E factor regulatory protein RseB domain-containing protein [bacterium]